MSYKSFSYLTPFSRRGPVNLLTPFSAIAISQRQWQIKSLLGNLIKNYGNNLYFHPRLSKFFFKPNSYLMSIFRHGPENSSITTFPNINLAKAMTNLLFRKSLKKAAIITICSTRSFIEVQNQIPNSCRLFVVTR